MVIAGKSGKRSSGIARGTSRSHRHDTEGPADLERLLQPKTLYLGYLRSAACLDGCNRVLFVTSDQGPGGILFHTYYEPQKAWIQTKEQVMIPNEHEMLSKATFMISIGVKPDKMSNEEWVNMIDERVQCPDIQMQQIDPRIAGFSLFVQEKKLLVNGYNSAVWVTDAVYRLITAHLIDRSNSEEYLGTIQGVYDFQMKGRVETYGIKKGVRVLPDPNDYFRVWSRSEEWRDLSYNIDDLDLTIA